MPRPNVLVFANYSVTKIANNVRLVTTHAEGGLHILVSYNTPVAYYSRGDDKMLTTGARHPDIWTNTTRRHIRDFGATMRPGTSAETSQVELFELLERITGNRLLA